MKKIGLVFVFLIGVCIGVGGLWLVINNNDHLRYYLLELPTRNQPQSQVDGFVQAIIRGDYAGAVTLWEIQDDSSSNTQSELINRRERVISDLIAEGINPEYTIMDIEWWRTCCELSVIHDSRDAGGARIRVQFLDQVGNPLQYTFDVFAREQPYFGGAQSYPERDWVIRDVYPLDREPLFWLYIYQPQVIYLKAVDP